MEKTLIEKYTNGSLHENCYFFHRENSKVGIIIDPGYAINDIITKLKSNEYIVKSILLTHGHFDHIMGVNNLRDEFDAEVYISKDDNELLLDAEKNLSNVFFRKDTIIENVKTFNNGDILNILDYNIDCIVTKGHTNGSACFFIKNDKIMFTGDTLFKNTFGRTDLYGGDIESMYHSLNDILFNMDEDILCFPGHGETTNIGYEKKHNDIFSYIENLNNLYKVKL